MNISPAVINEAAGELFDYFERLVDLSPTERHAVIGELRLSSPALAAELEQLLLADSANHLLDHVVEGGGQAAAAALMGQGDLPHVPAVPGYTVLRLIGEGGMGRVYLAERDVQGYAQRVAIKLVRQDRATAVARARFLSEQRHLAVLDHPGICRFIEAGLLTDGSPFVVMEVVEGRPIVEYCEHDQLDLNQRVALLRRLLDAVAHAHERLLIHRDLKAANVLVAAGGQPKLLDFGISKSIGPNSVDATSTSDRFFTLSASAPEQLLGRPLGVGCDLYALGLLAYRLLSGRVAYDLAGLGYREAEELILHRAPVQMSAVCVVNWSARLRGDLDAIVARCLRKDAADRYPNVRELDADLARWQSRLPIVARPSGIGYRARLFVRRNLARVAITSAVSVAALAGAYGYWMQAQEVARQREQALEERDRALILSQILEEAFVQADPGRAEGMGVSARAILDSVQRRLDEVRLRNPELFASLAASIARVEIGLGADSRAAELAQRALDAIQDSGGAGETRVALQLVAAEALSRTGRYGDAELLLDAARPAESDGRPDWMFAKARLEFDRRSFPEAEPLLRRLLLPAALDGVASSEQQRIDAQRLLVELLVLDGRLDEALVMQGALLDRARRDGSEDHPLALLEELELLRLHTHAETMPAGTAARFAEVISGLSKHYGARSVVLAGAHAAAARAYFTDGAKVEAIARLEEAAAIFREVLGEGHARTLRAHFNLALAMASNGRVPEGAELLERTQALTQKYFGALSPLLVNAAVRRARMYVELDRHQDALDLLDSTQVALASKLAEDDVRRTSVEHTRRWVLENACTAVRPEPSVECPPTVD
jgi:tetratricopeptide (TPR) repeat protein/predicted Ser/Thr protein kinase